MAPRSRVVRNMINHDHSLFSNSIALHGFQIRQKRWQGMSPLLMRFSRICLSLTKSGSIQIYCFDRQPPPPYMFSKCLFHIFRQRAPACHFSIIWFVARTRFLSWTIRRFLIPSQRARHDLWLSVLSPNDCNISESDGSRLMAIWIMIVHEQRLKHVVEVDARHLIIHQPL